MKILVKILLICLWTAIAAGVVVMMGFANETHQSKKCRGISCSIAYGGAQPLISNAELAEQISARFGKADRKTIGETDIAGISKFVRKNPYLENTDVLITVEGQILVKAEQCVPVIRFFASNGTQHYIDRNGRIMPVNPEYPCKTLIATGLILCPLPDGKNIFSLPDTALVQRENIQSLYDLHLLGNTIAADTMLKALIEQISITPGQSIEMVTKAGSHIVCLGDTTNAAEKLENLKYFYKYGLVKTGWNKYRKLNLEFKNQIVCTK
jgi:cell division protein FtsQ